MKRTFRPELPNGLFGDPLVVVRLRWQPLGILLDCGDTSRVATRTLLDCRLLLVSHGHVDHLFGIGRALRVRFGRTEHPLHVLGPPGLARRLYGHLSTYTWNLVDAFPLRLSVSEVHPDRIETWSFPERGGFEPERSEVRAWRPEDPVLEDEQLEIFACPLDHAGLLSLAWLLRERVRYQVDPVRLAELGVPAGPWLSALKRALRSGAPPETELELPGGERRPVAELRRALIRESPGDTLAYATDLGPTDSNLRRLSRFAEGVRRLILETPFAAGDRALALENGHLSSIEAGRIAREARPGVLSPFHLSTRYEDDAERVLDEVRREAAPVPVETLPSGPGAPP